MEKPDITRPGWRRLYLVLLTAAAIGTVSALWALAVQDATAAAQTQDTIARGVVVVLGIVVGEAAQSAAAWVTAAVPAGMAAAGYGLLTLWLGGLLAVYGWPARRAWSVGGLAAVLAVALDTLLRVAVAGREDWLASVVWAAVGIAAAAAIAWLWRWTWRRFPRLLNRETVSYVVFGILTTAVNMVAYDQFFNRLHLANLVSNALAWVAAVLFAYVVNKWFVFRSRGGGARQWLREFATFIGARVLSLGVDELGMFLLVDCLHADANLSKLAANVVVMILNYFFSKWFIFKKKEAPAGE